MIVGTLSVGDWGILFGILTGIVTIIGGAITAYFNSRKSKPEPPALVMAAGETGVKVLDGVVQVLRNENERYRSIIEAKDRRIDELIDEREEAVRAREYRIAQLRDQVRRANGVDE